MVAYGTKVFHDQFRPAEHLEVEALQDKVRFGGALHRHQEGVVDIAGAILPEVPDLSLEDELPGHDQQMIQALAFALRN